MIKVNAQSKCRPTLERYACSIEVASLEVPALSFSLFCRTIASQHRLSARLELPADEGENRSSGGEHLSVGGEQQTLQCRDWPWERREPRNRQRAANLQRSPGDALWAPAVI